ncbi:site-specific integrase, partial [Pseudomonas sp. ATCC 13867]
ARCRNALIVDWLYYLGLRRGELLSLRVSDIDFRRCVVHVFRRPDALDDPRRSQPVVKTRARELPLSQVLLDATRNYIVELRSLGRKPASTNFYSWRHRARPCQCRPSPKFSRCCDQRSPICPMT